MPLNIKGAETDRLAREGRKETVPLEARLIAIVERCRRLPGLTTATPDEILGYDEHGLPR